MQLGSKPDSSEPEGSGFEPNAGKDFTSKSLLKNTPDIIAGIC